MTKKPGELYSDLVEMDEKTGEIFSPMTVVGQKHKAQIAQAKEKMLAWAKEKAANIGNVDMSSHPTVPESLAEIFFSAVVKDNDSSLEHENFTFLPLSETGGLLCTIFKKTASNTGEPFVYCSSLINSYLPLSEMVKELSGMEDAGFRPAENILRQYKETQYTP